MVKSIGNKNFPHKNKREREEEPKLVNFEKCKSQYQAWYDLLTATKTEIFCKVIVLLLCSILQKLAIHKLYVYLSGAQINSFPFTHIPKTGKPIFHLSEKDCTNEKITTLKYLSPIQQK